MIPRFEPKMREFVEAGRREQGSPQPARPACHEKRGFANRGNLIRRAAEIAEKIRVYKLCVLRASAFPTLDWINEWTGVQ